MDKLDRLIKTTERPTIITVRSGNGAELELNSFEDTDHPLWTEISAAINKRPFGFDKMEYVPERRVYRKTYPQRFRYGNEDCDVIVEEPCTSLITPDHPQAEVIARVLEKGICR